MNMIREITPTEKLCWLRLIRSENVGPVTFFQLLNRFGSAQKALEQIPELAQKGGARRAIRVFSRSNAIAEIEALKAIGGRMIAACEPDYPPLLREIHDPPPMISIRGHSSLLAADILGIVGSRNASAVAIKLTQKFADALGKQDLKIASGLARGIDAAAHSASLQSGTIGVVGGGVDVVYPKENQSLHDEIAERGCIIAEQPLGTQPQARHFPRRNRIISGLSLGVLVVEATPKSGSLITARMAAEQGREVFAIPGSPMDPRAKGTNNLIRNGAVLTDTPEDIIDELKIKRSRHLSEPDQPSRPMAPPQQPNDDEVARARPIIQALLSPIAIEIDDIIRQSVQSPAVVLTILLELELAGRIERHFGNRVSLIN
jgi:DNA processing protein